jgi:signal transduction histidine kinase
MREFQRGNRSHVHLLVAGAFGVLALTQVVIEVRAGNAPSRVALTAAAGLVAAVLLLWRLRLPTAVVLGTAACAAVVSATARKPGIGPIGPAIALYTLATVAGWRRTVYPGLLATAVLAGGLALRDGRAGAPLAQAALLLCLAAVLGLYVGGQRQVAVALAARAAQLEREQDLITREAVLAERVWIARELHDVIGHHVSLLVVQAGAVRATVAADHPARQVCDSMIAGGRAAMTEMRRMVDLLRPVATAQGAESEFGRPPDLADVPALCEQLRQAGLPVTLTMPAHPEVPTAASVTAYRIVQEALTNVLKHAGPVATRVRLSCTADVLELDVTNAPGRGVPALPTGTHVGQGQSGMRQRVAIFDGEFSAGSVPGGGYGLRATLRLGAQP